MYILVSTCKFLYDFRIYWSEEETELLFNEKIGNQEPLINTFASVLFASWQGLDDGIQKGNKVYPFIQVTLSTPKKNNPKSLCTATSVN